MNKTLWITAIILFLLTALVSADFTSVWDYAVAITLDILIWLFVKATISIKW